jgi:hypothetical protein
LQKGRIRGFLSYLVTLSHGKDIDIYGLFKQTNYTHAHRSSAKISTGQILSQDKDSPLSLPLPPFIPEEIPLSAQVKNVEVEPMSHVLVWLPISKGQLTKDWIFLRRYRLCIDVDVLDKNYC